MFVDCETTERLQEAAALLNSSYDTMEPPKRTSISCKACEQADKTPNRFIAYTYIVKI